MKTSAEFERACFTLLAQTDQLSKSIALYVLKEETNIYICI